jgi:hypothetical protein
MAKTTQEPQEAPQEATFSKEDLIASKRFAENADLLSALLEDGNEYTAAQAEALAANYLGRAI